MSVTLKGRRPEVLYELKKSVAPCFHSMPVRATLNGKDLGIYYAIPKQFFNEKRFVLPQFEKNRLKKAIEQAKLTT
jgi:hypothetical protein